MAAKPNADEPANDEDEPTTEQTETVEVELAPADVERIEYEIENGPDGEHSPETVGEWIHRAIWFEFTRIDADATYDAAVEVEVPDAALKRAEFAARSRQQRGTDGDMGMSVEIEDRLMNDISHDYRWLTPEGAEIDLAALDEDD